jgi:hypothetical protein
MMNLMQSLLRRKTRIVAAASAAVIVACSGTAGPTSDTTQTTLTALNAAWTARTSGVLVLLDLVWTRDSVNGTGSYAAIGNTLGCGGGTLSGNGAVTFHAARSGSTVTGTMAFDNGWAPPYSGTLENNARIDGAFRSIDAGNCPFNLYLGLIP